MAGYRTDIDICNRALQLCRLNSINQFSNHNWPAIETLFSYDKMRVQALENATWAFAVRDAVLRPADTVTAVLETSAQTLTGLTLPFTSTTGVITGQLVQGTNIASGSTVASFVADTSVTLSLAITGTVASGAAITFGPLTMLWTPPAWAIGTTYPLGAVVTDDTEWWQSKGAGNVGNTPASGNYWRRYVGPDSMQAWNTNTIYFPGEIVLASDGAVYLALVGDNAGHDPTATTGFWLLVNGTASNLSILYPIGTGPASNLSTLDIYRLPRGFLRRAPTSPKSAVGDWLGVPSGMLREDWIFEGDYIVSTNRAGNNVINAPFTGVTAIAGPLLLRYVADVIDVPEMDRLFCEMLAATIADAIAPQLVAQETMQPIMANIARHLREIRRQAIGANGILIGSTDPPIDPYISCRW